MVVDGNDADPDVENRRDFTKIIFKWQCIPQAKWSAGTTSGRWRFIVSVTDLNKK